MDVECMWPGSVHDAKNFCKFFTKSDAANVKQRIPNYEIGDPAYRYFQIALKNMSLVQMMQKLFLITC